MQQRKRKKKKAFFFCCKKEEEGLFLCCAAVQQIKRKKKKAMAPCFSSVAEKEEDFSSLLQTKKIKKTKIKRKHLTFSWACGSRSNSSRSSSRSIAVRGFWRSGDGVRGVGLVGGR